MVGGSLSRRLWRGSIETELEQYELQDAFEAFNKKKFVNKNIQPSANPISCQWVDRVDTAFDAFNKESSLTKPILCRLPRWTNLKITSAHKELTPGREYHYDPFSKKSLASKDVPNSWPFPVAVGLTGKSVMATSEGKPCWKKEPKARKARQL
ncbi:hypothetical protein M5K25_016424 [Dendrobium thyrsiflorum]|uniref:Uncharacterized protein n=1 Tax=Dendrobium thyrsiflorum TaxID=117978 RepID=A0ABD0UKI0_DENTH